MSDRNRVIRPVWWQVAVFILTVMLLVSYILITTVPYFFENSGAIRNFTGSWKTEEGESLDITDLRVDRSGNEIVLHRALPSSLTDGDCLCFESYNAAITIWVDDREIYSYHTGENLTGRGYGMDFHEVPLRVTDSGHEIRIHVRGLFKRMVRIRNLCLGPAVDYVHRCILIRSIPAMVSLFILLLGLVMVLVYFRIPDKENMPFDILALAAMSLIIGAFLIMDTQIMQLLTGNVRIWRELNRTLPLLTAYPCVCFIHSITVQKKRIYLHIAFFFNMAIFLSVLLLRFLGKVDLARSFAPAIAFLIAGSVILMVIVLVDDGLYCREAGIPLRIRNYYPGLIIFFICAAIDTTQYLITRQLGIYGRFSRFGMLVFVLLSLSQFFRWWTRDRATIERDRFINRALQYAASYGSTGDSIQPMLTYMGNELRPGRIAIFEDQGNGKYRGTYEWHREGLQSVGLDLLYLPYEGFVDEQYRMFAANNRRLIVRDPEEFRESLPSLYNVMRTYQIRTLVSGALESGGRMIGFLTFIDTPEELLEETAAIIELISYFVTQMIQRREEQKRLEFYSYHDSLSGALNRRAFREFVDGGLDLTAPFGYLACNINGYEAANNAFGYEAGDRMANTLVQCLKEVFGEGHVYRMAGAGFAAFGFETDEAYFEGDVERARKLAQERELDVSFGSVYCAYGTMSIDKVIRHAEELMRAD